jgi:ABC-type amino acid transport system permease subunit
MGLRQVSTCRKILLQVNFFYITHLAVLSNSQIFLRLVTTYTLNNRNVLFFSPSLEVETDY